MMRQAILAAVILAASLSVAFNAQRPSALAFVGGTIVDGTGTEPFVGRLIVRGDRIEAVGAEVPIPEDARVVHAEGLTLIPGLFDLHTHIQASAGGARPPDWAKFLMAYPYSGVTSIVDLSSYTENFEGLRTVLREGAIIAPRVALASRVAAPGGHGAVSGRPQIHTREILTPPQAHRAMADLLAGPRPDLIKAFTDGWRYGTAPDMMNLQPDTLKAVVDGAHASGLPVISHTVTVAQAKLAVQAGVDIIGHGLGDREVDTELVDLMRARGTTYVPTLAVYESRPTLPSSPLLADVLPSDDRANIERRRAASRSDAFDGDSPAVLARQRRWLMLQRNVARLREGGVRFGLGSDAGMPGAFHGWATLHELTLLVQGGLTPLEALTAATGNSAHALGVQHERGTLSPGKLADLVLIEGRPHQTIADIERIRAVYLGGLEVDRGALKALIAGARTTLDPRPAQGLLDDFELASGRAPGGQVWVDYSDSGHDRSRLQWTRTRRSPGDHALLVMARLGLTDEPYGRLTLPLAAGGLLPVDVRKFRGVQFDVRGDGPYRLVVATHGIGDGSLFATRFEAGPGWQTVRLAFTDLTREPPDEAGRWTGDDVLSIAFELAGEAGGQRWLELDNVRLYS